MFVGINPGIETARTGFHFAHPSNRFWNTLYTSGFTPTKLFPSQNFKLLEYNIGITNVIERPTRGEKELNKQEFEIGRKILIKKIIKYKPKWVAFVGIGLYKNTFNKRSAVVGQQEDIQNSRAWVLPQPSGLNAHYPPQRLTNEFKKFAKAVKKDL